jgi:hypothetical protein
MFSQNGEQKVSSHLKFMAFLLARWQVADKDSKNFMARTEKKNNFSTKAFILTKKLFIAGLAFISFCVSLHTRKINEM